MSMKICPCPYIYLSTDTMHTQHLKSGIEMNTRRKLKQFTLKKAK